MPNDINTQLKSSVSFCSKSKRIYLMKLDPDDFPQIISEFDRIAKQKDYTKLFVKVQAKFAPAFITAGYILEASIPKFYNGKEDAFFLMKYICDERKAPEIDTLNEFQRMLRKPVKQNWAPLDSDYSLRPLGADDAEAMVAVFKQVFKTYPFPIFDPEFLISNMKEKVARYFGVWYKGNLIAISSAECDEPMRNAEMTDFAVLPDYRGKRLAIHLLTHMEEVMAKDGYKTLYTIARLHSIPMNRTFHNLGYKYSGTLNRNTQISGRIESMNVWYKNM